MKTFDLIEAKFKLEKATELIKDLNFLENEINPLKAILNDKSVNTLQFDIIPIPKRTLGTKCYPSMTMGRAFIVSMIKSYNRRKWAKQKQLKKIINL